MLRQTFGTACVAVLATACGNGGSGDGPDATTQDSPDADVATADAAVGDDPDAAAPDAAVDPDAGPEGPDLVISDVALDTTTIVVDEETATVTATVQNEGDETGDKDLEFLVEDDIEAEVTVTVEPPGDNESLEDTEVEETFTFSSDTTGDFALAVNDSEAGTVNVIEPPEADIVIVSADASPTSADAGENVTVTAVLQNQGDADGTKDLDFLVDGDVEETKEVSVDAPGAGEGPGDTEVEETFAFSRLVAGNYDLAVNDEDAGTVEVSAVEIVGSTRVTDSVSVRPSDFRQASVQCPQGTVPLSGGASVDGSSSSDIDIQYSYPEFDRNLNIFRWVVGVKNTSRRLSVTAEVQGVCADSPPGYSQETTGFALAPGAFLDPVVGCGSDRVVLGGGLVFDDGGEPGVRIKEGFPTPGAGDFWRVSVSNESGTTRSLEAVAVCAARPAGFNQVTEDVDLDGEAFDVAEPECRAGQVVTGGGFREDTVGEPDTRLNNAFVSIRQSGRDEFQSWVSGISSDTLASQSLTATAICADGD